MEAGNKGCLAVVLFLIFMILLAICLKDIDTGLGVIVLLLAVCVVIVINAVKMGIIAKFIQWIFNLFNKK